MTRENPSETLATLIEEQFLDKGNLDPKVDDIVTAWRAETGMSLTDSMYFINRRLSAACEYLDETQGWHIIVPVTAVRYEIAGEPDGSPADGLKAVAPCVAGQGYGSATVGIHFHPKDDGECWLWLIWRDFFDKVKIGVATKDNGNIERVINSGIQPLSFTDPMVEKRRIENKEEGKELKAISQASSILPTKGK